MATKKTSGAAKDTPLAKIGRNARTGRFVSDSASERSNPTRIIHHAPKKGSLKLSVVKTSVAKAIETRKK